MDYIKIYNQLIERSKNRAIPKGYVEHHHIIPRCMNGSNDKENIAVLTPEEHFLAHVLLVKIYPEHPGLIIAAFKMGLSSRTTTGRKARKLYGWLRRRHYDYMKEHQLGEGNSQYGTRWIHKGLENRKIKKGETVPMDWERGRLLKARNCTFCCDCGSLITRKAKRCKKCSVLFTGAKLSLVSDDEIIRAWQQCERVVDVARLLGYKNPNNLGAVFYSNPQS